MKKFVPQQPDPYMLGDQKNMTLARFGHLNAIVNQINTMLTSSTTGITAYAGGGQTNATQLTATFNEVTTVATAADSVKLLEATVGLTQIVLNDGANSLDVFPFLGDKINDGSTNASVSLAPGTTVTFKAVSTTEWETSDQILAARNDGTVSEPSITFASTPNMGLYRVSSKQLGVTVDGGLIAVFNDSKSAMNISHITELILDTGLVIESARLKDGAYIADETGNPAYAALIPTGPTEVLSGPGAIGIDSYHTLWSTTAANAGTLDDAITGGQLKKITMGTDSGDGTLTPTTANFTTVTFTTTGGYVVLMWVPVTGWQVIEAVSVTVA